VIDLVDTGIVIDAADRPHVFDRFYRGAAARQQSADGSGLGLAIAKTIVERHGGTIALGDGPGGCGCEARITLPY
jgi:signal transduction histidine kinase